MVRPGYNLTKKRLKKIPSEIEEGVAREVKAMLHAHRDCLRNQGKDTSEIAFDCRDGYYGEAFGIMRALQIMGYGYFGSDNLDAHAESKNGGGPKTEEGLYVANITQPNQNLKWWFSQLSSEVLEEEGYRADGRCEYCLDRYRKDTRSVIEKRAD